jgi:hypothetical protein
MISPQYQAMGRHPARIVSPDRHRPVCGADGRCLVPYVVRLAPITRSRKTYTLNLHQKLMREAYIGSLQRPPRIAAIMLTTRGTSPIQGIGPPWLA